MKFEATGARLGKAEFPPGLAHKDEFSRAADLFARKFAFRIPAEASGAFDLKVSPGFARMSASATCRWNRLRGSRPASGSVSSPSIFSTDLEVAQISQNSTPVVLAGFLVFGLLLAFTRACCRDSHLSASSPARGGSLSKSRALSLSLSYVIGMATPTPSPASPRYSGSLLAAALQNAWVLARSR